MSTIRFKFSRGEELRFISHLDQQRLFHRAFRRAGLSIAHSNGFNPHPKLSFALAMSVGLMSYGEYGDVVLEENIPLVSFVKRINAVLPKGIKVVEAWEMTGKVTSLSASLKNSRYTIEVPLKEGINQEELEERIHTFLLKEEVLIQKRNKRGKMNEKNIRPFIKDLTVLSVDNRLAVLDLRLNYIEQQCVKPELVLGAIEDTFSLDPTIYMTRTELNL